ncbi:MAG: glutamine--fructose-6-phosphate transaminase (isomerizing) [Chloroflexota bacterium]|nr:glutamine--fructose-6-phosphate transaminase (isomerizing) [Chloroflexota bacterium]
MCGIVGFVGSKPAAPIVLKAISRLEYRGYDSAGMVSVHNGGIYFRKDVGGIADVQRKHRLDQLPGNVALAHVRWATHGRANQVNAHPHFDCTRQVAVVHNGVIDNYQELRAELAGRHGFISEADTEVVCHLIEDCMTRGNSLEEAVFATTRRLKGSYAIAVISSQEPGKIVATACDVPLVVGLNGDSHFVASDVLCFSDETDKVVFLEEGDVASVTTGGVAFFNRRGEQIVKEPQRVDWRWEEGAREGHDCFMIKEILEGPRAIVNACDQDMDSLMELARDVTRAKQVLITACGSSRHAALLGRYLLSRLGGKLCHVITASESRHLLESVSEETLVIAVSQSGETADVVDGVRKAKAKGAHVVSIVNVVGSLLTRISDRVMYLNCGPEICVAATKTFVGQAAMFYLLAFSLTGRLEEGIEELIGVSRLVRDGLERNHRTLQELAESTRSAGSFFYIARGPNLAVAADGALKMKEVSCVHAECMPAGELKHGTLALIEEGTPVVAVCPRDSTFDEVMGNVAEVRARGGLVIGVSDDNNDTFDRWLQVPRTGPLLYPLAAVMPLHLLAYHVAVGRGKDPDRPRHLAKSVTVR